MKIRTALFFTLAMASLTAWQCSKLYHKIEVMQSAAYQQAIQDEKDKSFEVYNHFAKQMKLERTPEVSVWAAVDGGAE